MQKIKLVWIFIAVLLILGLIWLIKLPVKPGELDSFASCIKESGTTYYGAFWCPNCKNQEALFGRSAGLLPRVECSTPDGRGQLPVCQDAGVKAYPTWVFPDGTIQTGVIGLEDLSAKTSCALPAESIEITEEVAEETEVTEETVEVEPSEGLEGDA